jgi:hypothetical protein
VNHTCLHMHAPRDVHWNLVKRILRYLRGTIDTGITISATPSTTLTAYSDADWAGCPDTRRSTSGYCVFLGASLVAWSSKRQTTASRSSAEAEYRAVANAAAECCWLRNLLHELHVVVDKATVIYCDNVSAVYLTENLIHHRRTKHVELDIHFVREKVALGGELVEKTRGGHRAWIRGHWAARHSWATPGQHLATGCGSSPTVVEARRQEAPDGHLCCSGECDHRWSSSSCAARRCCWWTPGTMEGRERWAESPGRSRPPPGALSALPSSGSGACGALPVGDRTWCRGRLEEVSWWREQRPPG